MLVGVPILLASSLLHSGITTDIRSQRIIRLLLGFQRQLLWYKRTLCHLMNECITSVLVVRLCILQTFDLLRYFGHRTF
jgi:hypothetical protein